jgi:hypothetical protein
MWGFGFNPSGPSLSKASFQRFTEEGAAPNCLATSRIPLPLPNNFAARRRRASNFTALPLGLIYLLFRQREVSCFSPIGPFMKKIWNFYYPLFQTVKKG